MSALTTESVRASAGPAPEARASESGRRAAPAAAAATGRRPADVLALQRSIGNRATVALLRREAPAAARRKTLQRMAACPGSLQDSDPVPAGWKDYFGSTAVFHCGFRTILEDRAPTKTDPMNECVYDHSGRLVDASHPYSGCGGTPDQYDSKKNPIAHATIDSGGIARSGPGAFLESRVHDVASVFNWLGEAIEPAVREVDRGIRRIYGVP